MHGLDVVFYCRLVEEVRDKTAVALETDEVYMNTQFEDFIRLVVLKNRGGEETSFEYDAVSPSLPHSLGRNTEHAN